MEAIDVKDWRKLIWHTSKAFISLRISDLRFLGIEIGKAYLYNTTVKPDEGTITIRFKRKRQVT